MNSTAGARTRVAVVVLGDLARSPRMLNHARSLVQRGYEVSLIGYREKPLDLPAGVSVWPLDPLRRAGDRVPRGAFLTWSAMRMALLGVSLVRCLFRAHPDFIMVQNPPSFPVLAVAVWVARWRQAKLVLDWHNYGFSMLALRLSADHFMVRRARAYEFRWGRRADAHLCVSKALQTDLNRRAGIQARVLYDRPVVIAPHRTEARTGQSPLRVVCPAGWTADEDLELLVRAVRALPLNTRAIEIYVTGDGPTRPEIAPRLEALARNGLAIRTGFLPESEYRDLLGRADVGLSLHRSASGLDLAMKVADLYAARVPVCALRYAGSLEEQVHDGVTGFIFSDAQDLTALLARVAADPEQLEAFRTNIAREWSETWDEAWQREAGPLFTPVIPGQAKRGE